MTRVTLAKPERLGQIRGEYVGISGTDEKGKAVEVLISAKHLGAMLPLIQQAVAEMSGQVEGFFSATSLHYREEPNGHALLNFQFDKRPEVRVRIPPVGVQQLKIALCGSAGANPKSH